MDLGNFGVEVKENKPQSISDEKLSIDTNKIKEELKFEEIERFLPWFLKYQVEKFEDLIITKEIQKIVDFVENFKPGKGLLLAGPPGSGKTTTLTLVGEKYNFEVYEMNASDSRNKKSIDESAFDVIKQKSLFAKEKLILIDEVDGVSGTNDRGGVAQLTKLVKESKYRVVFSANDKESDKIKALKKVCTFIDFENHSQELLLKTAKKIFEAENISYNEEELVSFIEERNTTDIRGFINDLQASVYESKFEVETDLEIRDYKQKIDSMLEKIYYSYPEDSYRGNFNTDVNLDDLFLYLEENTANVYVKGALINAFNEISKADVFRGRIRKWQHWRFLVYVNFYLTFGVSSSKDSPNKIKSYNRNNRILKKWIYNNKVIGLSSRTKIQKEKGDDPRFIEKLAKVYGRSVKRTRSSDIKYFSLIYQNDEEFKKQMDKEFEIDESIRKALLEV